MSTLSAQFIATLGGSFSPSLPDATGVSFHTGRLRPGEAFFALPGENTHGIIFADEALSKGASFIVSDKPHPKGILIADPAKVLLELGKWARRERAGVVIGITGSAGKTSTRAFVTSALNAQSSTGNLNTPLALACILVNTLLESGGTTPLVLEMGIDHTGEMATLVDLVKPTHGILTLVAPSHLEGLGSVENVAREKAKLLQAASFAIASTQAFAFVSSLTLAAHTKSYGLDDTAHYRGRYRGSVLEYKTISVTLPALGKAMATNALAALVIADELAVPLEQAARRIETAILEPGRLQLKQFGAITVLDDTYNSNPASAKEALQVLQTLPQPHTAILGDMLELGTHSADYHFELGKQTRDLDHVIAIGKMAKYIAQANPKAKYFVSVDDALGAFKTLTLSGTILVKASRGMKLERVVKALQDEVRV